MLFPVIEYLAHHRLCTGIQFQQSVFLMQALEKYDSSELAKSRMEQLEHIKWAKNMFKS